MPIHVTSTSEARRITLEGVVDIGAASELQAALLEALSSGKGVDVSLEPLRDLDAATFQLLWAARRDAHAAGTPFRLTGSLSEVLQTTLEGLGLGGLLLREPADGEPHA